MDNTPSEDSLEIALIYLEEIQDKLMKPGNNQTIKEEFEFMQEVLEQFLWIINTQVTFANEGSEGEAWN